MESEDSIRLVEKGLRSAVYVTKSGDLYRRYEDTGEWETIIPRIDNNGIMKTIHNKSVSRVVAETWIGQPSAPAKVVVAPGCDPHHVDNLSWSKDIDCYRGTASKEVQLSKKLQKIVDLLKEGNVDGPNDLALQMNVKSSTIWTYICQILSRKPELDVALMVLDWIHPKCLEVCQNLRPKGSLTEAVQFVNLQLAEDATWNYEEEPFSQVRLARICVDIVNQ